MEAKQIPWLGFIEKHAYNGMETKYSCPFCYSIRSRTPLSLLGGKGGRPPNLAPTYFAFGLIKENFLL
jgi:hypothetical protein